LHAGAPNLCMHSTTPLLGHRDSRPPRHAHMRPPPPPPSTFPLACCSQCYPGGLNRSICCHQGVCTECYLQAGPAHPGFPPAHPSPFPSPFPLPLPHNRPTAPPPAVPPPIALSQPHPSTHPPTHPLPCAAGGHPSQRGRRRRELPILQARQLQRRVPGPPLRLRAAARAGGGAEGHQAADRPAGPPGARLPRPPGLSRRPDRWRAGPPRTRHHACRGRSSTPRTRVAYARSL